VNRNTPRLLFSVFGAEGTELHFAIIGLRAGTALMNLTTAKVEECNDEGWLQWNSAAKASS